MSRLKKITAFILIVGGIFLGWVAISLLSDMIKESFSRPTTILAFIFVFLPAVGLGWSGYWIVSGEVQFNGFWPLDSKELNAIQSSRPFILLAVFIVITSVLEFLYAHFAIKPSNDYLWYYRLALGWLIAWWVIEDSRVTNFRPCYEYPAFMFCLWIFLLPHYLFRTRGGRGLVLFGAFFILLMLPRLLA